MYNTFLIDVEKRGMGDFLFFCLLAIFLKEKFEKIYINYSAIHFNGMIYLINKLFIENNADNIICIGDEKYKNSDILLSDQIIYSDNPNLPEEIKDSFRIIWGKMDFDLNNNCFLSLSVINEKILYYVYYQYFLTFFGIKNIKEITNSISYTLNDYEMFINEKFYKKLLNKIDNQKYILVFHCIERDQYNFGFREYPNDLNKKNYKIIYMCDNNKLKKYNNNICYISELLGNTPQLYMLHKIIENAQEIHLFDSYPFHYLFLLKNIDHKTIMYPRLLSGYKAQQKFKFYKYNLKISNNYINNYDIEMFFNIYESYYPINYFKYINNNDNTFPYFQTCNEILSDKKNFKTCIEELSKYKVLPMIGVGNETGILIETILDKINFIEISLKNIEDLKNICKYIDDVIKKINNDNSIFLQESLNMLLIKTDGDYFLKIKPFKNEINGEDDIYLHTNIDNIEKNLIDIIDFYIENTNIHYIYPYKNKEDKEQFIKKIQIKSSEIFNNDVIFKKYNDLI
jgi:hypothetical protein